jgi:hypothetical protein
MKYARIKMVSPIYLQGDRTTENSIRITTDSNHNLITEKLQSGEWKITSLTIDNSFLSGILSGDIKDLKDISIKLDQLDASQIPYDETESIKHKIEHNLFHHELQGTNLPEQHPSNTITVNTTLLDGILSGDITNVEKAIIVLDKLDSTQIPYDETESIKHKIEHNLFHHELQGTNLPEQHPASSIEVNNTNLSGILSGNITTVEKALIILDNLDASQIPFDNLESIKEKIIDLYNKLNSYSITIDNIPLSGILSGNIENVQDALESIDKLNASNIPYNEFGSIENKIENIYHNELLGNNFPFQHTASSISIETESLSGILSGDIYDVQSVINQLVIRLSPYL